MRMVRIIGKRELVFQNILLAMKINITLLRVEDLLIVVLITGKVTVAEVHHVDLLMMVFLMASAKDQ